MKSDKLRLIAFLIFLTVLISPWRNTSTQDDGAYAYSAISLSHGSDLRHAGTIAINFTQFFVGSLVLKALPFLPPIAVLNFLTWIIFISCVFFFFVSTGIHWSIVFAFFAFPIWIQYGACYHGETYSGMLLVLLLSVLNSPEKFKRNSSMCIAAFILSLLLGTQLQNMAAFPVCWGGFMLFSKEKNKKYLGLSLILGSLASVIAFALMPKTPFQSAYSYWLNQMWLEKGAALPLQFVASQLQMLIGTGLYLTPVIVFKNRSKQTWLIGAAAQVIAFFVIEKSGIPVMSAGVLFIDYLPRPIAILLLSAGVWGWWGVWPHFKNMLRDKSHIPVLGSIAGLCIIWIFSTWRFALDLRYMMTWGIPILYHCRSSLGNRKDLLGNNAIYLTLLLGVSALLNNYMLNTTDARWAQAAEIEQQGVPKNQIAAGYGWNIFYIGSECMYKSVEKLEREHGKSVWTEKVFYDRFLSQYGRAYEDEWIPRFILKPSKILGFPIYLRRVRLPGQDADPIRFVDYTVLGIPSQLAVYENENPQPAWCDK